MTEKYLIVDLETDFDPEHPPEMPEPAYNKCPICKAKSGEQCITPETTEVRGSPHESRPLSAKQPSPPKSLVPFRAPLWKDRDVGGDRIVCAGTLMMDPFTNVNEMGGYCLEDMTEQEVVQNLVDYICDNRSLTLVTFNGHRFDMPFLVTRAIHYDIPIRPLMRQMRRSNHIDLYFVLDPFKKMWGRPNGTLSGWCEYFGLTPDIYLDGDIKMDGSMVHGLVAEKKWDELISYNRNDLLQTADLLEQCLTSGLVEGR